MGFLNSSGLAHFWDRIKSYVDGQIGNSDYVTMEQVNAAIDSAISSAIEEAY